MDTDDAFLEAARPIAACACAFWWTMGPLSRATNRSSFLFHASRLDYGSLWQRLKAELMSWLPLDREL
jgi:hypothetical protein